MSGLLTALVDDAGLFPPEQLDMASAVARHRVDAATAHPMLTHRFVCPASRLGELAAQLGPGERITVSVIADQGWNRVPVLDPRFDLAGLEGPVEPGWWPEAAVPVWCELGWSEAALAAIGSAPAGRGIKLRCGGVSPQLYPPAHLLAAAISDCVSVGVPFKATAGLHKALSEQVGGVLHYGYLSLLLATAAAVAGGDRAQVERELRGAPGAVERARSLRPVEIAAVRALFTSYGSCSTAEPREEAATLGLAP